MHSVTSGAVYDAINGTKQISVSLQGWDSNNVAYDIMTSNFTARKINPNLYSVFVEFNPQQDVQPNPSSVIHLIKVNNANIVNLGNAFCRGLGVGCNGVLQLSGQNTVYLRLDTANWLPTRWGTGTNTLIQISLIVKVN